MTEPLLGKEPALKQLATLLGLVSGAVALALHFVQPAQACAAYQATLPLTVTCNIRTARGFYWALTGTRLGPYGKFGVTGDGRNPACDSGHLGSKAQTRLWLTDDILTPAQQRYCRMYENERNKDCSEPDGPVREPDDMTIGVFEVECREMPSLRNPFR
jgi:hypothetical protein